MKKFKFRYEQLLNIRMHKVDDLKHTMGELNFKLNALEVQKAEKLSAQAAYFEKINHVLSEGCTSQELLLLNQQKGYYNHALSSLDREIRDVKLKVMQVREQLNEAVKEQKIMEKLKEKDFEHYLEEIEAADTKVTEEIVNYTNYKGREE